MNLKCLIFGHEEKNDGHYASNWCKNEKCYMMKGEDGDWYSIMTPHAILAPKAWAARNERINKMFMEWRMPVFQVVERKFDESGFPL